MPLLDTRLDFPTPEGITLQAVVAGPVVRAYAWLLDLLVRALLLVGLTLPLSALGHAGTGLTLILFFALTWFYHVGFEVLRGGATPGKRALGLQVVHDDLTPVGWQASLLRNLLRSVDLLPGTYALGLLAMLLGPRFQRLGDLVAGTLVIHARPGAWRLTLPETEPAPPPLALRGDEQQAILAYAQRQGQLSPARRAELAALLPALGGAGPDGPRRLLAIANWLAGRAA